MKTIKIRHQNYFLILVLYFFATFNFGCGNTESNEKEYFKYLNNEKNNVIKIRYINGFKLCMKYLPPEFLAYKELSGNKEYSRKDIDSLIDYYSKSLSFSFSIGPDERKELIQKNITYYGVFDEVSFKERIQDLNFYFAERITMETNKNTYSPAIYLMENAYEANNSRVFIFVFVPDKNPKEFLKREDYDIVFDDNIFDTGVSHYNFKKSDIENIPSIGFWKTKI